jgi:hypothetical protein
VSLSSFKLEYCTKLNPNDVEGINEPTPGLSICADARRALNGLHWYVYYWLSVLAVEGVLVLLAFWKAWTHHPLGPVAAPRSLMQQLTKDSMQYFLTLVLS